MYSSEIIRFSKNTTAKEISSKQNYKSSAVKKYKNDSKNNSRVRKLKDIDSYHSAEPSLSTPNVDTMQSTGDNLKMIKYNDNKQINDFISQLEIVGISSVNFDLKLDNNKKVEPIHNKKTLNDYEEIDKTKNMDSMIAELSESNEFNYFCKLYDRLNQYIFKILSYDDSKPLDDIGGVDLLNFYPEIEEAKGIVKNIVRDLNYFNTIAPEKNKSYFNFGHRLYFEKFSDYIFQLRRLFITIKDSCLLSFEKNDRKMKNFPNLLVLFFEKIMMLSKIEKISVIDKTYEKLDKKSSQSLNKKTTLESQDSYSYLDIKSFDLNNFKLNESYLQSELEEDSIDYLNVIGKKDIKTFAMSKKCITNYQYMIFVNKGGYSKNNYWSKDGIRWKYYYGYKSPKNWKITNGEWYIDNNKIDSIFNLPVIKISYYEAEACAKFYGGKLPSESQWEFAATNRNQTLNAYGLYNPPKSEIVSDFDFIKDVDNGLESLLGFKNLYGNVWEYTSDIRKNNYNEIEVCLKGGDSNFPEFLMNNNLKLYLPRDENCLQTGFRIIKI